MSIFINENGPFWTQSGSRKLFVKTGSDWQTPKQVLVKSGTNTWSQVWKDTITEEFAFQDGGTFYGTSSFDGAGMFGRIRRTDNMGVSTLTVGAPAQSAWQGSRGFWRAQPGSVSNQPIETALRSRTLTSFKLSIQLAWSSYATNVGDDSPSNMAIYGVAPFGVNSGPFPEDLNLASATLIARIVFYGAYSEANLPNSKVLRSSTLGTNPPVNNDRYPVFAQDVELLDVMSTSVKLYLTSGSIQSFLIAPYYFGGYYQPNAAWETRSGIPNVTFNAVTGPATNFKITVTHEPQF